MPEQLPECLCGRAERGCVASQAASILPSQAQRRVGGGKVGFILASQSDARTFSPGRRPGVPLAVGRQRLDDAIDRSAYSSSKHAARCTSLATVCHGGQSRISTPTEERR